MKTRSTTLKRMKKKMHFLSNISNHCLHKLLYTYYKQMPTYPSLNQKLLDYHIQFALFLFSLFSFASHDFTENLKLLMFLENIMHDFIHSHKWWLVICSCNESEPKSNQVVNVGIYNYRSQLVHSLNKFKPFNS